MQLSTTRLSCLACAVGFFGVLQMLVMQNSPHRQSGSLLGHIIVPQACARPRPVLMRQPFDSAYATAASISGFWWHFLGMLLLPNTVLPQDEGCQMTTSGESNIVGTGFNSSIANKCSLWGPRRSRNRPHLNPRNAPVTPSCYPDLGTFAAV